MTTLAQRNPQAFGVLVTLAGVMIFVPDALVMRLIGGDMLALAFWRGILAGGIFLAANLIFARQTMPSKGEWFDRKGLLVIGLNAMGGITWCAAMQYTRRPMHCWCWPPRPLSPPFCHGSPCAKRLIG
jgi:hypothetical protein